MHQMQPTGYSNVLSSITELTRRLCPLQARYLSVDDLADWVIHLLTVLVLGRVAFLAFKARHIPQGANVCSCPLHTRAHVLVLCKRAVA
jgi:hypothetical protein